jgi:hypothetical protein
MGLMDQIKAAVDEQPRKDVKAGRAERTRTPDEQWEYLVLNAREGLSKGLLGGSELERTLNDHGARGWELVQIVNDRAVLKRRGG